MAISPRELDLLQERQARVFKVLDIVTKPVQMVFGGIAILLCMLGFLFLVLSLVTYGLMIQGPKDRTNVVDLLNRQKSAHRVVLALQQKAVIEQVVRVRPQQLCGFDSAEPGVVDEDKLVPAYRVDREAGYCRVGQPSWIETSLPATFQGDETWRYTAVLRDADWNFQNTIGANLDWAEGKQTPLYVALLRANQTLQALQFALAEHRVTNPSLPGAPTVAVQFVTDIYDRGDLVNDGTSVEYGNAPAFVITGLCNLDHCQEEDFKLNTNVDLFGQPSVTAGQQQAITLLAGMETDQFWLKVAHANGVFDDQSMVRSASANRIRLPRPIGFRRPSAILFVILFIAIVFALFFVSVRLCGAIFRKFFSGQRKEVVA